MLLTFSVENCKNICEKSYFQDVNYKFQKLFFHKQNLFTTEDCENIPKNMYTVLGSYLQR